MKILETISYFYPAWEYGGPGKLIYELSKSLVKRGHGVTVYTTDSFARDRRRGLKDNLLLEGSGIRLQIFTNISNYLAYKLKAFLAPGVLRSISSIRDYDCIHIHEFFTLMSAVISLYAKIYKIPLVVSVHGTLDSLRLKHRGLAKDIFFLLFGNRIIREASAFIAATREEINEYQLLGVAKDKIHLIPNGIDTGIYEKLPSRGVFREKHNISKNEKIILFVGRIHRLKGLNILLQSYRNLWKTHKCRLVIAGSDDGAMDDLMKYISKEKLETGVVFTGVLYGRDKLEAFSDTDIFVYPSPSEGFSIAILEAGAAGLPLLITKGCKFPEIEKFRAGIVVEARAKDIYNALKMLLDNPDYLKEAGKNAKKLIGSNYTIDKMALSLEKIYKDYAK